MSEYFTLVVFLVFHIYNYLGASWKFKSVGICCVVLPCRTCVWGRCAEGFRSSGRRRLGGEAKQKPLGVMCEE